MYASKDLDNFLGAVEEATIKAFQASELDIDEVKRSMMEAIRALL